MYPSRASFQRRNSTRRRDLGGGRPSWARIRAAVESCRDHADALYALGLIRSGDDTLAMESVVNAIVAASANPLFVDADQVQMWRLVAPNVLGPDRRAQGWPDPSRAGEEWAPSALEQEMIALKAAGRTPSDIDALVRTRPVLRSVR